MTVTLSNTMAFHHRRCVHRIKPGVCTAYTSRSADESIHIPRAIRSGAGYAPLYHLRFRRTSVGDGFCVAFDFGCVVHCGSVDLVCSLMNLSSNANQHPFRAPLYPLSEMWSPCVISSANRIPERLVPGRFDLIFASHQIFHVHVILAALSHYNCILIALDYRHASAGPG
jgi:hypothetical protein